MERRRVVVTGIGAVTPIGLGAEESWQAARAGICGIGPITQYDPSGQKVKLAAEVKGFDPEKVMPRAEARHTARFAQMAVAAATEAAADSGIDGTEGDPYRRGAIVSSGIGGLTVTTSEYAKGCEKGFDRVSPYYIPMAICNMAAGLIAIRYHCQGLCACPVTACAGGTNAVGDAFHYIRDGYADMMFCGGSEAVVTPLAIGGFTSMKALSTAEDPQRASIPFDRERSGFVLGEGAGILVLEEAGRAQARGAKIYAEIVGYGISCDAYHMTAPAPDGAGAAAAMAGALADGGTVPEAIDYINAHGTATPPNDKVETQAIKTVFGPHAGQLAVSSTKSMTGHMLGAAGAVEAIFTALSLRDGFIPPTINYREPDPACDLDVTPNVGRAVDLHYALSNSLGFGGHNACVLLKKWEG